MTKQDNTRAARASVSTYHGSGIYGYVLFTVSSFSLSQSLRRARVESPIITIRSVGVFSLDFGKSKKL